jgi:NitT/TauT family transport system substrate-binding protein
MRKESTVHIKPRSAFLSRILLIPFLFLLSRFDHVAAESSGVPTTEKVVVAQFGKEKFLLYLPFYTAMEEGFFAKRGIDIDLRFVGNDDQIFATVISGDALFGVGDPVFAAISREKGGPGRIVALMITKLGLSGFTNKKDLKTISTPEDLKGLRISSFPSPSTTYTLLAELIRKHKLTESGTSIVQAAVGAQLAALEAGQVDFAVDLEPAVSIAESKGYQVNFSLDQFTDPQAITGISTLESTIQTKASTVQKIVSGLQEALTVLHSDPQVGLRVSKKLFPTLSEQVIRNALARMFHLNVFPASVKIDDALWQRTLQTRLDSGDLKKPQATSFTVENSFAEQAIREANHS